MKAPGRGLAGATIALLVLIWGTTWAGIRISLGGIPPMTGVALRFAIAAVLLIAVARVLGVPLRAAHRRERNLRWIHALLSFCVSYGVVFWAEQWLPSGLASVLFATFSLMVVVMAHLWLPGERLTATSAVGVVVGFAGVAVIYAEDFSRLGGHRVALAAVVMLAAPLASAVASVVIKRHGKGVHPVSLNAVAMAIGSVIMGVIALALEHDRPVVLDLPSVAALLYLAVLGSAVTFVLYFWLLEHMAASRLSLVAYGVPVVAVLVGWLALNETVTLRTLAGSGLVVAGVALASGRKARPTGAEQRR